MKEVGGLVGMKPTHFWVEADLECDSWNVMVSVLFCLNTFLVNGMEWLGI